MKKAALFTTAVSLVALSQAQRFLNDDDENPKDFLVFDNVEPDDTPCADGSTGCHSGPATTGGNSINWVDADDIRDETRLRDNTEDQPNMDAIEQLFDDTSNGLISGNPNATEQVDASNDPNYEAIEQLFDDTSNGLISGNPNATEQEDASNDPNYEAIEQLFDDTSNGLISGNPNPKDQDGSIDTVDVDEIRDETRLRDDEVEPDILPCEDGSVECDHEWREPEPDDTPCADGTMDCMEEPEPDILPCEDGTLECHHEWREPEPDITPCYDGSLGCHQEWREPEETGTAESLDEDSADTVINIFNNIFGEDAALNSLSASAAIAASTALLISSI